MMNFTEIIKVYEDRIARFSAELKALRKQIRTLALIRLAVFLGAGYLVYFFFGSNTAFIPGVVGTGLFLFLVKKHLRMQSKARHLKMLIQINQEEIQALNGDQSAFGDGKEFQSGDHAYAHDLEIFGAGSIFQWLNRTVTSFGKEKLAQTMLQPNTMADKILSRQKAIQELGPMLDWRQHFRATGLDTDKKEVAASELMHWIKTPSNIASGILYKVATWVIPFYSGLFLLLFILGMVSLSQYLLSTIVPLSLVSIHLKNINRNYLFVGRFHAMIMTLSQMLNQMESQPFQSKVLSDLKAQLKKEDQSAGASIAALNKILSMLDQRNNILIAIPLNIFFLWDILYTRKLQQWQSQHQEVLPRWIAAIAEMDALSSLANLHFNRPELAFAAPVGKDQPFLDMQKAGHPLLATKDRIDNTFQLKNPGSFVILTGANMAGKSTFLRTVGVNLILAHCGAPVCATNMKFQPGQLFSSMRTTDSLQKNESYFFTELKRLKAIVDRLESGQTMFIILDEILKGTNSRDKERGSRAFLVKLLDLNATGIVATHDLSLCSMAEDFPDKIQNQCFEVEIDGKNIHFDYRLRNGVCQNLNATFLMQQMGITGKAIA